MRRALVLLGALITLGACATVPNTPEQDLAWERWRECDKFPTIRLQEIGPDGQIWVYYRTPADLTLWRRCEQEARARQQRTSTAAVSPASPTPPVVAAPPPVRERVPDAEREPVRQPSGPDVRPLSPQDLRPYYAGSWAVVIGIDQYRHPQVPRLNYAVADARAIADALPRLGFPSGRLIVLENTQATKARIEQALYGSLASMGKDDRLFVFFAGHGYTQPIKGGVEGYLLSVDADPANLPLTSLAMRDLAQIGKRVPAKHVLFVLDTCFSGYAVSRDVAVLAQAPPDLLALTQEPVVQILTAGTQGQRAFEEGGHGLFTKHLLKGLEGWADPQGTGLTVVKLAAFIQERVARDSAGAQTPQYGKLDGEGEFLFRPPRLSRP